MPGNQTSHCIIWASWHESNTYKCHVGCVAWWWREDPGADIPKKTWLISNNTNKNRRKFTKLQKFKLRLLENKQKKTTNLTGIKQNKTKQNKTKQNKTKPDMKLWQKRDKAQPDPSMTWLSIRDR